MKILIDARLYGLENAGLGRYVINLIGELSKIDSKNHYTILLRKKYFNRLKFPSNWKQILAEFRHYSLAEQIKLPSIITEEKPDLVHFPHFNVPYFYKGKFVVTIHDLLMHKQKGIEATTLSPILYYLKRLGYRQVFDRAIEKSVKIIVPSESVKKDLVNFYCLGPEKVVVTYEGFDEKIKSMGDEGKILEKYGLEKPYFIYSGNAYPHKNLKRLIEAVVALNANHNGRINLAIVSSRNVFVRRLEKQINTLGTQSCIKLLGFVPDKELGILYKSSVAFVFPSTSEGFGLPGLEAMNAGTLVLASDIPVFREVYKENAIYFNPFDFSAIEKAMKDVLEVGSRERLKRIKLSQEFSKRYSWRKMAEETLEVYESCIGI